MWITVTNLIRAGALSCWMPEILVLTQALRVSLVLNSAMYMYYTVSNRILPSCKDTHCSPVSFIVLYYWSIISRQFSTMTTIAENRAKCGHIKTRAPTQFSNYSVSHYIRGTHYHYLTMLVMRGLLSITEYNVFSYITTVIGTKSVVGSNLGVSICSEQSDIQI